MEGADIFFGLSAKGALTPDMVRSMAPDPIIFAMANPDPEITPEEAHEVRDDVIMATGRSDYPNQVNNVLGFPYIFRGALDVRAKTINMEMKVAAAQALADLARGLSLRPTALRARLYHPDAVRSASDPCRADGGRQSGDGVGRRSTPSG
jgi:malic enzyme